MSSEFIEGVRKYGKDASYILKQLNFVEKMHKPEWMKEFYRKSILGDYYKK